MEAFIAQRKLYKWFGNSLTWLESDLSGFWVVSWPNEALTYLEAPMELSGTLKGSLQIKNNLEAPTLLSVQGYVQDDFGRF